MAPFLFILLPSYTLPSLRKHPGKMRIILLPVLAFLVVNVCAHGRGATTKNDEVRNKQNVQGAGGTNKYIIEIESVSPIMFLRLRGLG